MSNKELVNKLNDMDILSKSQIDRMNQNMEIQENLFGFLSSQITKIANENSMKNKLLEDIQSRMEEEGFDTIPWAVVLKLLEIFSKEENEIAITLLNMIKEIQIKNSENDVMDKIAELLKNENSPEFGDLSKEEMNEFKELLSFLKNVKDSELPEKN